MGGIMHENKRYVVVEKILTDLSKVLFGDFGEVG
jgi:hypothetical protein